MKRIGYDADTRRYYFRDQDGSVWQGAEGAEFGVITRGGAHHFSMQRMALSSELFGTVGRLPSSVVNESRGNDVKAHPPQARGSADLVSTAPRFNQIM